MGYDSDLERLWTGDTLMRGFQIQTTPWKGQKSSLQIYKAREPEREQRTCFGNRKGFRFWHERSHTMYRE